MSLSVRAASTRTQWARDVHDVVRITNSQSHAVGHLMALCQRRQVVVREAAKHRIRTDDLGQVCGTERMGR